MSEFKTRDAVAAKLREICVEILGPACCSADQIRDDSDLFADLHVDSLDLVELVMETEETFGFTDEIPDAEIEALRTFGQLVDLVCGKLGLEVAA